MALTLTSESTPKRQELRRLAMVFGLWVAVAVVYWPSTLALDELWRNTS